MKIKQLVLSGLVLCSATFSARAVGPLDFMEHALDYAFSWTPDVVKALHVADAKKGEVLAKKGKCSKCHGDLGVSDEDDTPSIAGQTKGYILKQLIDYKNGDREDRSMKKAVKKLSAANMADIGAYYEAQKAEKKLGGEIPSLVTVGDRSRLLLACNDCHNESAGIANLMTIPATLEGQKPEYFVETLTAFKEGDRTNDLYGRMRFIAERLTDEEIELLGKYYSAKPIEEDDE